MINRMLLFGTSGRASSKGKYRMRYAALERGSFIAITSELLARSGQGGYDVHACVAAAVSEGQARLRKEHNE